MSGDILHDLSRSFIFKTPPNADFVYDEEDFLNPRSPHIRRMLQPASGMPVAKNCARPTGITDPGYNRAL
jgi:hypothetical protein